MSYRPRDFVHFARMLRRNRRRQTLWGARFQTAIEDGTYTLPSAAVVQILPTETCNLRCPMCNQWGENSYFHKNVRQATHMDPDALVALLRGLEPQDTLLSLHGGEPFAYKHTRTLLETIAEQPFDVMITTNGTLLEPYLEPLARIENLSFLLSIDGDETTHDEIRGKGNFRKTRDNIAALAELRRKNGQPLPMVVMSFVVCEFNAEVIETAYEVAREVGAFALNYNMRWFLTEEIGQAYEQHLWEHFGRRSTGAWRGWISNRPDHDYSDAAAALRRVLRRRWRRPLPPYVVTTPSQLSGRDFDDYFNDYNNVFGNDSCFMPFYWARVHANGDLIYCPGHPDIIVGNVFEDGFEKAFNSPTSIEFRQHILHHRFPICNRCCGLYMTNPARPQERRVRQRLGLGTAVETHLA